MLYPVERPNKPASLYVDPRFKWVEALADYPSSSWPLGIKKALYNPRKPSHIALYIR